MAKVKFVNKITDKSFFPTHSKFYTYAHRKADEAEKKRFPKIYKEENKAMMQMLRKDKHELMGVSTKSGKVFLEKKFKKFKKSLTLHELKENKEILKEEKMKKKRKK